MDSQNQFILFFISVAIGFLGGVLYEIFGVIRSLFKCPKGKNKALEIALDIGFFLTFAFLTIVGAYAFCFPSFRVYMFIGYALGGGLYLKTLHIMVAFLKKICYNKITQVVKKVKKARKNSLKEVDIE